MLPLLFMLLTALAPAGASAYALEPESFRDLDAVKSEFGEKPVATIRQLLAQRDLPEEKWKRAVDALKFTGAEGADYLVSQLHPRVESALYDERTAALLRSLGSIYDRRAVEYAVRVLVVARTTDIQRVALNTLQAQAEQTPFAGDFIVVKPDGKIAKARPRRLPVVYVSGRATRSKGRPEEWPDRELLLGISRRLRAMAAAFDKEKNPLAWHLRQVVDAIDEKEAQLQAALAKIEAGEG